MAPAAAAKEGFSVLEDEGDEDVLKEHSEMAAAVALGRQAAPDESRSMVTEVTGGTLTTLLTVVLNITYAGVIMGSTPELQPYMSHGIAMCLACTAISNLWLLCTRRNLPFICVSDSFMAVLFAASANNIARRAPDASLLGTLAVAMVICSTVLALGYIAVGVLRMGKAVQFVPSPVMAGYQASIGWLMLDSASTLASGCSLKRPECLLQSAERGTLWLLAAGLGTVLYIMQQRLTGVSRILVLPGMLFTVTLAFQLALYLQPQHGIDLTGWALKPPAHQSFLNLPSDLHLSAVSWKVATNEALLTALTAFVPNLLGKLLQYSALENRFDCDVDYNLEIRHAGFSQLVSVPAIMTPTVTYLGMVVAWDLGARSFLPPAMVIVLSAALVLAGPTLVALVPTVMFAALLVNSGLLMLHDNLRSAWTMFPRREFVLVLTHIVLTAALGMLSAVVLGVLFTATIFIVQYASHSGVLQSATSLLERSKVTRTVAEQVVLERYGATVLIVHLHGMIFFGSANSVVEEVRAHILTLSELGLPLRFLLLDFDRCSAIDSSAVSVLFQTRRLIKEAALIFACAGSDVLSMLKKGAPSPSEFEHFTTLDLALEQCENRLLTRYLSELGQREDPPSPVSIRPSKLQGAHVVRDSAGYEHLLREASTLEAIDEHQPTQPVPDDARSMPTHFSVSGNASPDSDDDFNDFKGTTWTITTSTTSASTTAAGATSTRVRHKLHNRGMTGERLPNPFTTISASNPGVGLAVIGQHEGQPTQYHCPRPASGANASKAASSAGKAALPGADTVAHTSIPASFSSSSLAGESDSDGVYSDSSTGGGLATIYSPDQARAALLPEALLKMKDRFTEGVFSAYGATELDDLFSYMDIMLIPPRYTVVSSASSGLPVPPAPDGSSPPYLYVIDRGYVSAFATIGGEQAHEPQGGEGGESAVNSPHAARGENPRHRLAKYGPGSILGVASFVDPGSVPGLNVLPTAAISDTYCQLLRLPRSRCDELEKIEPALLFRLYRLLVFVSERRLHDHRMRVVASEAFKINVRPSQNFQRMLATGSLSDSKEQLQQFPQVQGGVAGSAAEGGSEGGREDGEREGGTAAPASAPAGAPSMITHAQPAAQPERSHETSPLTTPMSTPTLEKRGDVFVGPALQLFERMGVTPTFGALSPGHEALPVASLASFQSAMLTVVNQPPNQEVLAQAAAPSTSTVSSMLWPQTSERDNAMADARKARSRN